jgi:hypothetical protein
MSRIFTEKRKDRITGVVLLSLIVFLYAAALMQARTSYSVLPAQAEYQEDINRDGQIDELDVLSLIILGMTIPESHICDYNSDSVFNLQDIVSLLLNIRHSKLTLLLPVDTSATDTTVIDTTVTDTTATDTTGSQTVITISGYVYCLTGPVPNINVTMIGDAETSTFTDGGGYYEFQISEGSYTIVPVGISGFGFEPPMRTVAIQGLSLQRLDFLYYGVENIP